jgi:hypothetical protein
MTRPRCARQAMLVLLTSAAAACGDDGGGGGPAPELYWVSADPTAAEVTTESVELFGLASCDACPPSEYAFGGCPPVAGPFLSGIDVVWTNLTTGASGSAFHAISGRCACLFSTCWVTYMHRWWATVPLGLGPNEIELLALGPEATGTGSVTVTRVPAAPEGVTATAVDGAIEVRWEPVAEATGYVVYWSTAPGVTRASATAAPGATSPFVLAGFADDTSVHVAVAAASGALEGPLSAEAWATVGWRTETVPLPDLEWSAADAAIAVDSLGTVRLHVARRESDGVTAWDRNRLFTGAPGAWSAELLGDAPWVDADAAVDAFQALHASYVAFQGALHVVRDGVSLSALVDPEAACDTSLALDVLGGAHLAYRAVRASDGAAEIRYATDRSGAWVAEPVAAVASGCDGVATLALAVEPDGRAHLVHAGSFPGGGLEYAVRLEAWAAEPLASGFVRSVDLALDALARPVVAYCDAANVLHVVRGDGAGTWTAAEVDPSAADSPSVAVDASGRVRVGYFSFANGGELRLATEEAGGWRIVRVAPATSGDAALALDADGLAHLAYLAEGEVRYATER